GPGEELLEALGRADPAEPAAEDDDPAAIPLGTPPGGAPPGGPPPPGAGRGHHRQPPGAPGPKRRLDARADHTAGAEGAEQCREQRRHRNAPRRTQPEA